MYNNELHSVKVWHAGFNLHSFNFSTKKVEIEVLHWAALLMFTQMSKVIVKEKAKVLSLFFSKKQRYFVDILILLTFTKVE